jgi:hypothetical protein
MTRACSVNVAAVGQRKPGPFLGMKGVRKRTSRKENVMILALPLAMLGAAFLTYVRFATR